MRKAAIFSAGLAQKSWKVGIDCSSYENWRYADATCKSRLTTILNLIRVFQNKVAKHCACIVKSRITTPKFHPEGNGRE